MADEATTPESGPAARLPDAIACTAEEVARELLPGVPLDDLLCWPPDLFAFTSCVLARTGAYRWVIAPPEGRRWPARCGHDDPLSTAQWLQQVTDLASEWRTWLEDHGPGSEGFVLNSRLGAETPAVKRVPPAIQSVWERLREGMDPSGKGTIEDLNSPETLSGDDRTWHAFTCLVLLHCVVDELCAGWGIAVESSDSWFRQLALTSLAEANKGSLATIHPSRGRVLPKIHTPQVGIALRSMSQNLTFTRSSVRSVWPREMSHRPIEVDKPINCLVLPWPLEIDATSFHPASKRTSLHPRFSEFSYEPPWPDGNFATLLSDCLDQAKKQCREERIDLVVLPEAALVPGQQAHLEKALGKAGVPVYIAGYRGSPKPDADDETTSTEGYDLNYALIRQQVARGGEPFWAGERQHKHHRWKLDRGQLLSYELDSALSISNSWWEAIGVPDRLLTLLPVGSPDAQLVFAALICEDLARQDPVAEVVRAVGPSLVVTLLMDGPQTPDRWASRYATVLAEDPGSSVLSVTSAGMVRRWMHARGKTGSAIVGLWRDRKGEARQLTLEEGSHGLLLRLHACPTTEITADGRANERPIVDLELGTWCQIKAPSRKS